jgi:hypothetical protein
VDVIKVIEQLERHEQETLERIKVMTETGEENLLAYWVGELHGFQIALAYLRRK